MAKCSCGGTGEIVGDSPFVPWNEKELAYWKGQIPGRLVKVPHEVVFYIEHNGISCGDSEWHLCEVGGIIDPHRWCDEPRCNAVELQDGACMRCFTELVRRLIPLVTRSRLGMESFSDFEPTWEVDDDD